MSETRTARSRAAKKRTGMLLRVAIVAFVVFVVVSMVQTLLELDRNQKKLDSLNQQIAVQLEANERAAEYLDPDGRDAYYEQELYKNGQAKPGEDVYQEVPGA